MTADQSICMMKVNMWLLTIIYLFCSGRSNKRYHLKLSPSFQVPLTSNINTWFQDSIHLFKDESVQQILHKDIIWCEIHQRDTVLQEQVYKSCTHYDNFSWNPVTWRSSIAVLSICKPWTYIHQQYECDRHKCKLPSLKIVNLWPWKFCRACKRWFIIHKQ